jgi:hypothetical protein
MAGKWGGKASSGGRDGGQARAAPEPSGEIVTSLLREGYRDRPDVELRVTVDEFQGHRFLGLRLWEMGQGDAWYPTRKGLSIRLNEAATVAAAILEALDRAGGPPDASAGRTTATPRPRPSTPPARRQLASHPDRDRAPWEETAAALEPATPGFSEFPEDGGHR